MGRDGTKDGDNLKPPVMMNKAIFKYQLCGGIVKLLNQLGAETVVLSPGSRSAPLALSFMRNAAFRHYMVPDERSAGFIALGIASRTQKPVCLVCTSATAVLNYGPALAEAYFNDVPLIAITADRPPEWIGQQDNQAVYQNHVFEPNIKKSFQLDTEDKHPDNIWNTGRIVNEAFMLAAHPAAGPVHINIPFREPLYLPENTIPPEPVKLNCINLQQSFNQPHPEKLPENIIVACGNNKPDKELEEALATFLNKTNAVFLPDIASKLSHLPGSVRHFDRILKNPDRDTALKMQPDLLITLGNAFVSKQLKSFFRNYPPKKHIHLHPEGKIIDPFMSVTDIYNINAADFFTTFNQSGLKEKNTAFRELWQNAESTIIATDNSAESALTAFSEPYAVRELLKSIPQNTCLHAGNSLPVRLVDWMQTYMPANTEVYANRGTSGIDGCLSTATGAALADPERLHLLVIGDLSFFYDRNGLWINALPHNLRIMILNNNGGGIFRILPGAKEQEELEAYFAMPNEISAAHTAAQHGAEFLEASNAKELKSGIMELLKQDENSKCTILEVRFEQEENLSGIRQFLGV